MQTDTFMRIPLKPILKYLNETEEHLESSRRLSKQEESKSERTGDTKNNKNEDLVFFTEKNVIETMVERPSFPQHVESREEMDIYKYTSGNDPMHVEEVYVPSPEENGMSLIVEDSSSSDQIKLTLDEVHGENSANHDSEPSDADKEPPVSLIDEIVLNVSENNSSLIPLSEVITKSTFIENPPFDSIVEMGNEQITPSISEESGQEHTFHVNKVDEKEKDQTIVSSDTLKTDLEDQELQKKSYEYKEEQLTSSIDLLGINDLKENNLITATDPLNIQIPVIVGKYNIEICLEDEEIFEEKVKEIREISNKVLLTTCKFIPSELSQVLDNGSCKALKGNLLIDGIIEQQIKFVFENKRTAIIQNHSVYTQMNQKNAKYLRKLNFGRYSYVPQPDSINNPNPTSEVQTNHGQYSKRLINSMNKTIPFSSVVAINHFLHPPIYGSIEEKSFTFQNNPAYQMDNADTTQFTTTTYYPENTHGKLIFSKLHENINFLKYKEKYIKNPRIKLKQYIVLELWIHLLQEQSVQVKIPKNGI
ncbi:hypothetical protein P5G62_011775 [Neobacillus sp. 179-C4.2 HS]|uniref:DUF7852 domain-containing protein n=1 Tax=Neobacillus driksii TaxID=3035913 RepID=A0ABV4YTX0_9BACI|nr:hypothetical protein [Neobacillus sp. 179.-C4.2 HS]MDP5194095.1 hypothetical protein [Neobacillus sp. 179.-C4.2 HS]